jgi:hypothetical protein
VPAGEGLRGFLLPGLIADPAPVMINPAMAVHADADTYWTDVNAHSVHANASSNRANVGSDARPMPPMTTRVIYPDAADDRARLGRYECDRGSREAQSENYLFHVKAPWCADARQPQLSIANMNPL